MEPSGFITSTIGLCHALIEGSNTPGCSISLISCLTASLCLYGTSHHCVLATGSMWEIKVVHPGTTKNTPGYWVSNFWRSDFFCGQLCIKLRWGILRLLGLFRIVPHHLILLVHLQGTPTLGPFLVTLSTVASSLCANPSIDVSLSHTAPHRI